MEQKKYLQVPIMKGDNYAEKRKSLRVSPPLFAVTEVALWFKSFDAARQINLSDLGMPHIVSVNKEERIVVEDISGEGIRLSLEKKALILRGIKRITDHMTVYLKLCTSVKGKHTESCMLVGIQLTGVSIHEGRIILRARILVQARADIGNNKLTFFNIEKAGVKDIHVLREELIRMPKRRIPTTVKRIAMEHLLIELMSDDATQADGEDKDDVSKRIIGDRKDSDVRNDAKNDAAKNDAKNDARDDDDDYDTIEGDDE